MNTPYLAEISIRSLFRLYAVKLEHSATANQLSRTYAVQSRYRLGVSNPMMDTLRETHEPSSSSNLQVPSIELLDLSLGLITSVNSQPQIALMDIYSIEDSFVVVRLVALEPLLVALDWAGAIPVIRDVN